MPGPDWITGIHPVREALASGRTLDRVYLVKELHNPRLFDILKICRKQNVPVTLVPPAKLQELAPGARQGVAAKCPLREYAALPDVLEKAFANGGAPALLLLDGVQDPQNLGALLRSALCAGFHAVILPSEGSAGVTPGAVAASAGAAEHLAVCRVASTANTARELKTRGLKLVGCEARQGKPLWEADLTGPLALVLGAEEAGIKPHLARLLDEVVHLPITGPLDSLNVSAAGAVAMFEAVRQRRR